MLGKSLPFSCIRDNQLEEMYKASIKNKVYPMLIIFFSDIEKCYALHISDVFRLKQENKSKSIPLSFCEQYGLKIDCEKKRIRYRYKVIEFLEKFNKNT